MSAVKKLRSLGNRITLFILACCASCVAFAEDTLFVAARFKNHILTCAESPNGDSIPLISKVSVYISNLEFLSNGRMIQRSPEPRLIHLCNGKQQFAIIPNGADAFTFTLGIDSSIQVKGALSGALDPVHGFYWTWQSGYIHAKIEAEMPDHEGQKKEIIWHLGGYQAPYNSIRRAIRKINRGNASMILNLDALLNSEFISQSPNVMTPGKAACKISSFIVEQFTIEP